MKKYAILVAGGNGSRMKSPIPKQFLILQGKPVLFYTITAFLEAYIDVEVVLVLPADYLETGKEIIQRFFPGYANIIITAGGETRFHSVQNGLKLVKENSVVFVHDAVRCLITSDLIKRCHDEAVTNGTAIPYVISRDSVRILKDNKNETIDRSTVALIQTPQVFLNNIILPAFNVEYNPSFTDEASVVETAGVKVKLIIGEETNIKITNPIDLVVAEKILMERNTA